MKVNKPKTTKPKRKTGNAKDGVASDMADAQLEAGADEATVVTVNMSDRPLAAKKAKEQEEARKEVDRICFTTEDRDERDKLKEHGILVVGIREEIPGVDIFTMDVTPEKAAEILGS